MKKEVKLEGLIDPRSYHLTGN